mgnify:CR=1 FL=1
MGKQKVSILKAIFRIIRLIFCTIFVIILLRIFCNFVPILNKYIGSVIIPGLIMSVLICSLFFDKENIYNLGLKFSPESIYMFIYGLIIALVSVTAVAVYSFYFNIEGTKLLISSDWFNIDNLSLLGFYFLVSFGEELFFRGYIISTLRNAGLNLLAALISSFVFMLIHLVNSETTLLTLLGTFMAGILLAIMYMKSNNLWMCIGFHLAWNYLQDAVILIPTKGTELAYIVVLAFMIIIVFFSFKLSGDLKYKHPIRN